MKKLLSLGLILCILLCFCSCSNHSANPNSDSNKSDKGKGVIGRAADKVNLDCPELGNIANFMFDHMTAQEHYFTDANGILYAINFEKPFYETKTNAKVVPDVDGFDYLLRLQSTGWYESTSYIDFIHNQGLDAGKTVFFRHSALTFRENKLYIYDFVDTSESFDYELEENNEFRLLEEFDQNIISINGCIIKTESDFYAIEQYITNADDVEKYADVTPIHDIRIVELDDKLFSIPKKDIKFLYMPATNSGSYFMIDQDDNVYLEKTYLGNLY